MISESNTVVNNILTIVLFPLLFQESFVIFAWGANDPALLVTAKRLFLLLPVLAIIAALWISIASLLTVLFRNNRQNFVVSLFITWWDLGKSIFSFWGGVFKFVFVLLFSFSGLFKVIIFGLWAIVQDVIILPFRLLVNLGRNITSSSIPLIAVILTLFWCFIEAVIFTYITTPLVIDVLSNITGQQLAENAVRIPLFIFLLFIVLGSYAVLSTFFTYVKSKDIPTILGILAVEIIVIFVEVTFLYREFVDSLVPWLAQYSENFELGIFWTLAIAAFVWFGIRSLSWFLFAAHGTPTILQIIQGKRAATPEIQQIPKDTKYVKIHLFDGFATYLNSLKKDAEWIQVRGEDILNAFILPPLQIVAAVVNFCTLLIASKHLFDLPFKSATDFADSSMLFHSMKRKETPVAPEPLRAIQEANFTQ